MLGIHSVHLSQLATLGIKREWIYFFIIFLLLLFGYQLLRSFIYWVMIHRFVQILTFLMLSILLFVGVLIMYQLHLVDGSVNLLVIAFRGLALFGGVISIVQFVRIYS